MMELELLREIDRPRKENCRLLEERLQKTHEDLERAYVEIRELKEQNRNLEDSLNEAKAAINKLMRPSSMAQRDAIADMRREDRLSPDKRRIPETDITRHFIQELLTWREQAGLPSDALMRRRDDDELVDDGLDSMDAESHNG